MKTNNCLQKLTIYIYKLHLIFINTKLSLENYMSIKTKNNLNLS